MKRIEYHKTRDRSEWSSGEWDNEPDKIQWFDETSGLPCLMVRNHYGNWCGYVGVSQGHPAFQRDYDFPEIEVHGGLTFADKCQPGDERNTICHIVEPGEDDNVWWLGFDTGHYMDFSPATRRQYPGEYAVYRNQAYVSGEVLSLAKQLKAMAPTP